MITASQDATAAIWHVMTGEKMKDLKDGHTSAITCVDTFVPTDARSPIAITGSADRSIVVWHMRKGEKLRHFPDISQEPIAAISIFCALDGISPIVIISDKKANLQLRDLYPSTFMPNKEDVQRAYDADAAEQLQTAQQGVTASGPSGSKSNTGSGGGVKNDNNAMSFGDDDTESWSRLAKFSAKYQVGFWLEHGFLFMQAIIDNRVDFLVKFKDMLKESLYSLRGITS